jgi:hypothetical protein
MNSTKHVCPLKIVEGMDGYVGSRIHATLASAVLETVVAPIVKSMPQGIANGIRRVKDRTGAPNRGAAETVASGITTNVDDVARTNSSHLNDHLLNKSALKGKTRMTVRGSIVRGCKLVFGPICLQGAKQVIRQRKIDKLSMTHRKRAIYRWRRQKVWTRTWWNLHCCCWLPDLVSNGTKSGSGSGKGNPYDRRRLRSRRRVGYNRRRRRRRKNTNTKTGIGLMEDRCNRLRWRRRTGRGRCPRTNRADGNLATSATSALRHGGGGEYRSRLVRPEGTKEGSGVGRAKATQNPATNRCSGKGGRALDHESAVTYVYTG